MKRLILVLFSTIISLAILAQNEAFVVEQKNGLADIFKVTENIRVKHEKDSVFIVYGDSVGESYTRTDIKRIRFNEEKVLVDSVERAALVALYKATDGDNWTNKTNWCSDKPISEWYGVGRDRGGLFLYLNYNNLKGQLPLELTNLNSLYKLELVSNKLEGSILPEISRLVNLIYISFQGNSLSGSIPDSLCGLKKLYELNLSYNSLSGEIPKEIGNLSQLYYLDLQWNKFSGIIPSEIGNLKRLTFLSLYALDDITAPIPPEIGNLNNLIFLYIGSEKITGNIPLEISNLSNLSYLGLMCEFTGNIPPEFGRLKKLEFLNLSYNHLSGPIPSELGELTQLKRLMIEGNLLEGEIPESFNNLIKANSDFFMTSYYNKLSGKIPYMYIDRYNWYYIWCDIMAWNKYNLAEVFVPAPLFRVTDINGAILDSKDIYPNHKYTAIFHWDPFCGYSRAFMPEVVRLYKKYRDFGFEVIGLTSLEELANINKYIKDNEIEWPNFLSTQSNMLDYPASGMVPGFGYPFGPTPEITLIDSNGRVAFTSVINNRDELSAFLEDKLGEGKKDEYYTSTDYSQDGKVKMLQTATKGDKAINIVLIGEGFVDKDMNDGGKYDLKMNEAMENFFAEQPITALREYFNVYAVKAVSPNAEFFNNSKHAINEDNNKAFEYAIKAVGENAERMMIGVIYNSEYAGRSVTSMYNGDGSFVAYIKESNSRVLSHEMGGHGLAQLLDEYVEPENNGKTLPDDMKALLDTYWEQYSVGANVDYHNNPSEVKWAEFLTDERYAKENLGLFEGGFLYTFGCYRPTANSMMRYGDSPFNVPSREAIYKHVMKYSNPSWQYNREEFVQFDKNNFNYEKELSKKMIKRIEQESKVEQKIENNLPPKIINGGWKNNNGK